MNIRMLGGLPIIEIEVRYKDKVKILKNVLLDTGSANTIFDVDSVEDIGLVIDSIGGKARRMYGIGGESELCYEQSVENLDIGNYSLNNFIIQLGMTKENYGFECILGVDFMIKNRINLDFDNLYVR